MKCFERLLILTLDFADLGIAVGKGCIVMSYQCPSRLHVKVSHDEKVQKRPKWGVCEDHSLTPSFQIWNHAIYNYRSKFGTTTTSPTNPTQIKFVSESSQHQNGCKSSG